MGRHKLKIPNAPVSASIPAPLLKRLRSYWASYYDKEGWSWGEFVAAYSEAWLAEPTRLRRSK